MTAPLLPRYDHATEPPKGLDGLVYRQDRATLRPPKIQPDGSIRVDAQIAAPGVYVYAGGRRELVTAEVLSDPAALETLKLRPVTLEHPDPALYPRMVTPDNVAALSVGSTGEDVALFDGAPRFSAVVNRRDALDWIRSRRESGQPIEVSPGYFCSCDETPGVHPEFGAYDAIQVRRVYNHLALTEAARGGGDCRARLDSNGAPMNDLIEALVKAGYSRADALQIAAKLDGVSGEQVLARLTLDAKSYEDMEKEKTRLESELAQVKKDMAKLKEDMAEEDPKADSAKLLVAVEEINGLRAKAAQYDSLKAEDVAKLDAAGLRAAIAGAAEIKLPDGLSDTDRAIYLRARIDALPAPQSGTGRDPRLDGLRFDGSKPGEGRTDSGSTVSTSHLDSLDSYRPTADKS